MERKNVDRPAFAIDVERRLRHDFPTMTTEECADPLDDLGVIGVQQTVNVLAVGEQLHPHARAELANDAHEHPVRDPVRAAALDAADRGLGEPSAPRELHLSPAALAAERPNRKSEPNGVHRPNDGDRDLSADFGTMACPPFAMLVECGHMRRAIPRHG